MKRRRGCRNALWAGLTLLFTVMFLLLFAEVDSEMPMYEEGAIYERN